MIEFCIFYPKTEELVLLIYANEYYDAILLFEALKGIEVQTTVKSPFSNLLLYNLQCGLTRVLASTGVTIEIIDLPSI